MGRLEALGRQVALGILEQRGPLDSRVSQVSQGRLEQLGLQETQGRLEQRGSLETQGVQEVQGVQAQLALRESPEQPVLREHKE